MNNKNTYIALVILTISILLVFIQPWASTEQQSIQIPELTQIEEPSTSLNKPQVTNHNEAITKPIKQAENHDVLPPLVEQTYVVLDTDGRLADKLPVLIEKYQQGDLEAGFQIVLNLQHCLNQPVTQEEFETLYERHIKLYPHDYEPQIETDYEYCEGISKKTRESYYNYLEELIRQDHPQAQEHFGNVTPPYMLTDEFKSLSEKQKQQHYKNYRKKANELLFKAAENGYLLAITYLSSNYRSGEHVEKDLVKALAYNITFLQLTTDSGIHNMYSEFDEELRQKLTPNQISEAEDFSKIIIQKILKNGKIYHLSSPSY